MKLFLATANSHKVEEFERLFAKAGLQVEVCSANAAGGMPYVEETEPDFIGNARLKAMALWQALNKEAWVLADDSGLEVEALGGEPGVHSARYAGAGASNAANRTKLLDRLEGVADSQRQGHFVCVLLLLDPRGEERVFQGVCTGRILGEERGAGGFGYDPVFLPDGFDQTFGEMEPEAKDRLSHRGRALRALIEWMAKTDG